MKTKSLALVNGIVGLVGGILLLLGPFLIVGTVATLRSDAMSGSVLLLNLIKIAILVLGIVAIVYYKGDERVGVAPSVLMIVGNFPFQGFFAIAPLALLFLMIVGGAIALVPLLGWIGGIIAIIGGSLYLASLKKFSVQ